MPRLRPAVVELLVDPPKSGAQEDQIEPCQERQASGEEECGFHGFKSSGHSRAAAVYRRGRPHRSEMLILRALPSDQPLSRFGYTASKALGNAVKRNRLKRRLREAVRSLPVAPGWDVVLNARRAAADADYHQLRASLAGLLDQAGLLTPEEGS